MPPSIPIASTQLPGIPANSSVRRLPFVEDEIETIAAELGQPVALAPFRIHGEPVYRIVVPLVGGAVGPVIPSDIDPDEPGPVTTLTLWPSLRRVDAVNPWATMVATGVIAVDLVAGVEAIFRHAGGSLTVARNGRVMVRTGPITTSGDDPAPLESSR